MLLSSHLASCWEIHSAFWSFPCSWWVKACGISEYTHIRQVAPVFTSLASNVTSEMPIFLDCVVPLGVTYAARKAWWS